MKILLDSCIPKKLCVLLEENGFDVEWCGDWNPDPGDEDIIRYAYRHKQILITLDKDFGELTVLKRIPHFGIIRLSQYSVEQIHSISHFILTNYHNDLNDGALITAQKEKIRIRRAVT